MIFYPICLFIDLILLPLKSMETWLLISEVAGINPFPNQLHSVSWTVIMEGEKFNKQGHVLVVKKSQ